VTATRPTALIADDEPLLREAFTRQLALAWPELEIVAEARNGREALKLFEAKQPDICFLDVQMPGLSGVEAARGIGRRAHLVFVTAFDHYAVQAFAQGVLDYLVKPVERDRLAETVARL
jgi:YesN/AraC family two-component response regulator